MDALTKLILRVELMPFQDHTSFLLTLSSTKKNWARLVNVLDLVLLGKS